MKNTLKDNYQNIDPNVDNAKQLLTHHRQVYTLCTHLEHPCCIYYTRLHKLYMFPQN